MIEIVSVRPAQKKPLREIFNDMERIMADFDVYMADERDRDFARWLERRPVCVYCGEHIQEETALCLEGDWICEDCVKDHMKDVEDEKG
jgi:formylmethanofuran dehydrogenase subunit E